MKILLSAHACEPNKGSEEGVGWHTALEAAKHHEIWVLTRSQYQVAIEAAMSDNPNQNLNFIYFEAFLFNGLIDPWQFNHWSGQLHYYLWQLQAYFVVKSFLKDVKIDLIRHVTYVKYWSPSFLSLLPVPFLWGPVGGGEAAPKPFWKDFGFKATGYEILRLLAQRLGEQDPFTRMTARRSLIAYATTHDTAKRLKFLGAQNVEIYPEVGLSGDELDRFAQFQLPNNQSIRFISIGRLLHWKGFHLGLRAFLEAEIENSEYWIVGTGSERKKLEDLVANSKFKGSVRFFGMLPRHETIEKLEQSHVVVHPSLHDSGGWACLEAMATGRPVICLDLGGPAVQVTDEAGFKVAATSPDQVVQDIASAMVTLAKDPDLRIRMGQAGKERVREAFDWNKKGQFFSQVYEDILAHKAADGSIHSTRND
jgi:glycosyltransferase involved in cell wall biosynthesis